MTQTNTKIEADAAAVGACHVMPGGGTFDELMQLIARGDHDIDGAKFTQYLIECNILDSDATEDDWDWGDVAYAIEHGELEFERVHHAIHEGLG